MFPDRHSLIVADHRLVALFMECECLLRIIREDDILIAISGEFFYEIFGHSVQICQNNMVVHLFRQFPGSPCFSPVPREWGHKRTE